MLSVDGYFAQPVRRPVRFNDAAKRAAVRREAVVDERAIEFGEERHVLLLTHVLGADF